MACPPAPRWTVDTAPRGDVAGGVVAAIGVSSSDAAESTVGASARAAVWTLMELNLSEKTVSAPTVLRDQPRERIR